MRRTHWRGVLRATFALTVVLVILQVTGLLGQWYEVVWQHTPGRPWTYVMRDYPWLLIVPAQVIIIPLALWLPLRYWSRAVLIDVVLAVGYLAGHVFWGS